MQYSLEVKKIMAGLCLWALLVGGALWGLGQTRYIPGFITGLLTAQVYFLLMCYRVKKSVDMPVVKAIGYMRTGWVIRLIFVVLMLYVSAKASWLAFWPAVIGFFSLYVVLLCNAFIGIIQRENYYRKG